MLFFLKDVVDEVPCYERDPFFPVNIFCFGKSQARCIVLVELSVLSNKHSCIVDSYQYGYLSILPILAYEGGVAV